MKIINPCSENWEKMTPSEQGRFCQSCQKTVIDCINKTPNELRNLIKQQKGNFCGRITQSQLDDYNLALQNSSSSYFRKWSLAAALSALVYGQQIYAEPIIPLEISTIPLDNQSSVETPLVVQDSIPKIQGIIVRGRVIDMKTTAPVSFATVRLKSSRFETQTDSDGYYKLIVPQSNDKVILESFSNNHEFKEIEITPSKNIKGLVISLKHKEEVLLGFIVE